MQRRLDVRQGDVHDRHVQRHHQLRTGNHGYRERRAAGRVPAAAWRRHLWGALLAGVGWYGTQAQYLLNAEQPERGTVERTERRPHQWPGVAGAQELWA